MNALYDARRLWQCAGKRLSRHRGTLMLLGIGRLLTGLLGLCMSVLIGRTSDSNTALLTALLLMLLAAAPMRTETARQLCDLTGVLTEDDRGFLDQSSRIGLWKQAAARRLLLRGMLLLAFLPAILLAMSARVIWLTMEPGGDALLPLLTILHLLLLVGPALLLPLRVYTAETALPFVLLKMPECGLHTQLRMIFRLSRGQMLPVLMTRLCCLPAILLPYPGAWLLPTLLGTELMRYHRRHRMMQNESGCEQ